LWTEAALPKSSSKEKTSTKKKPQTSEAKPPLKVKPIVTPAASSSSDSVLVAPKTTESAQAQSKTTPILVIQRDDTGKAQTAPSGSEATSANAPAQSTSSVANDPAKSTSPVLPRKILIAGTEVPLPAAPRWVKDEILAPIADGLAQLSIKVSLRESDKSLHVESATGKRLSLYADNTNALVDGKTEAIPVAPIYDGGRFFLPVFTTAKVLGLAVRTDNAVAALYIYPTLTAVQVTSKEREVEVKLILSAPVKYTSNQLQDTVSKVYFDLAQTMLGVPTGEVWKGINDVQRVRVGQFSSDPAVTRVVVDTTRPLGFVVKMPEKPNEILIAFTVSPAPTNVVVTGAELRNWTIVVDAGHGGKDPGTHGRRGTLEKDIALDVSLRLQACLMKRGANVLMTRLDDSYPTLSERAGLANRSLAHLFVSVHVNSDSRPNSKSGTMVLYATPQSLMLARSILASLLNELKRFDMGVRYRPGLYVLRHTMMPSVIAEVAYLDNHEEEALLNDPEFRQKAAEAIAQGVVDYVQNLRK
jgi:N-acetylmuramoyl-L-alanine amidase